MVSLQRIPDAARRSPKSEVHSGWCGWTLAGVSRYHLERGSTMQVSLPPELESFVESRVSAGEYQSSDAVVAAGLSLLQKRIRDREDALSSVRAKIRIGV